MNHIMPESAWMGTDSPSSPNTDLFGPAWETEMDAMAIGTAVGAGAGYYYAGFAGIFLGGLFGCFVGVVAGAALASCKR